jgi:curved DNA-binding protein
MTDPYSILGIDKNASDNEIKSAYRKLAKEHHPDRGGDGEKFAKINAAYDSIKDANARSAYQQEQDFSRYQQQGNPFRANPFEFEDFFSQHFNRTPRNQDVNITIYVDLEDVIQSTTKTIQYNLNNGSKREVEIKIPKGVTEDTKVRFAGLGDNSKPGQAGNLFVTFRIKHHKEYSVEEYDLIKRLNINIKEAMVGTTKQIDTLDGRSLRLNIKPGTQSGTRLRIPEGGLPRRGHPNGNLYIEIKVKIPSLTEQDLTKTLEELF